MADSYIEDEDIGTGGYELNFTSASAAVNSGNGLAVGRYYMLATQDCWVKRGVPGATTAAKAVATELKLKANVLWPVKVTVDDVGERDGFAVIRDTADGTIQFFKVSR